MAVVIRMSDVTWLLAKGIVVVLVIVEEKHLGSLERPPELIVDDSVDRG